MAKVRKKMELQENFSLIFRRIKCPGGKQLVVVTSLTEIWFTENQQAMFLHYEDEPQVFAPASWKIKGSMHWTLSSKYIALWELGPNNLFSLMLPLSIVFNKCVTGKHSTSIGFPVQLCCKGWSTWICYLLYRCQKQQQRTTGSLQWHARKSSYGTCGNRFLGRASSVCISSTFLSCSSSKLRMLYMRLPSSILSSQ